MSEKNEKLTKKELRKFSLRYAITAQASQSYEAMQGIACVYSMGPFFEKWFADDPELMQKKFQNNLKFFNCQTYFGAAITAAALAIEQDRDPSSLQLAASLKTSLMGPFSGIGDALFNTIPKVVMGAMTAYAAIEGNWITSIIMIAIFTPLITWVRQKMIESRLLRRRGIDYLAQGSAQQHPRRGFCARRHRHRRSDSFAGQGHDAAGDHCRRCDADDSVDSGRHSAGAAAMFGHRDYLFRLN